MKIYELKITVENEQLSVSSRNDGFNSLELLALLELKRNDILRQISGEIKPDIIKRELVED